MHANGSTQSLPRFKRYGTWTGKHARSPPCARVHLALGGLGVSTGWLLVRGLVPASHLVASSLDPSFHRLSAVVF